MKVTEKILKRRKYHRDYRTRNKSRMSSRDKERRDLQRCTALIYLGGCCVDCGEDDERVLQFDHIKEKARNVSWFFIRSLKKLSKELSKCQLVCANCHMKRTRERAEKKWKENHETKGNKSLRGAR